MVVSFGPGRARSIRTVGAAGGAAWPPWLAARALARVGRGAEGGFTRRGGPRDRSGGGPHSSSGASHKGGRRRRSGWHKGGGLGSSVRSFVGGKPGTPDAALPSTIVGVGVRRSVC
eukprot:scaffold412_cov388-Prasinococcus_capsulatus_cf.AAC.35